MSMKCPSAGYGEESKGLEEKVVQEHLEFTCVCGEEHCRLFHVSITMGEGYQNDVIAQKINYEVKYLCMIIKMILLHHDVCISQLGLP